MDWFDIVAAIAIIGMIGVTVLVARELLRPDPPARHARRRPRR